MEDLILNKRIEKFRKRSDIKKIDILIEKRFNSLEKNFLSKLINQLKEKKSLFLVVKMNDIPNSPDNFLDKLTQKKIKYRCKNKFHEEIQGTFPIISSYQIYSEDILIILSTEFLKSFQLNNFFKYLSIGEIILFKEKHSLIIFLLMLKNYEEEELELSIEELKSILKIEDQKYPRYYDFEKNVILKFILDINEHSHMTLSYEKIKKSESKNSKVIGVKFKYKPAIEEISSEFINNLMEQGKNYIQDFVKFQNICLEYIESHGKKMVLENFNYSLKNFESDFLSYFKNSLENNVANSKTLETVVVIEKKYSSLFFLYSEVIKILNKLYKNDTISFELINQGEFIKILRLEDNGEIKFSIPNHIISVKYSKKDKSKIIFQKK